MDVCRAVVALLDDDPDMTQEALARRLGRSPSYVSDALKKLRRDPPTQRAIARGQIKGRAASLMTNRASVEREQLVRAAEAPVPFRPVITAPSTRSMTIPVQGGRIAVLSRSDSLARLEVSNEDHTAGSSIRMDLTQVRRLQRGLRLLGDAMEQELERSA